MLPEESRQDYITRFRTELETYSFSPRRQSEPMNDGCKRELEQLVHINIFNPEELAKWIKEGIHFMYQKGTSKRVITSIGDNLENETKTN